MRAFLRELAAAAPTLPDELGRAWTQALRRDSRSAACSASLVLLAVFAALGFGLEWLFWWATTGFRDAHDRDAASRPCADRLRAVGRRARLRSRRAARLRHRQRRRLPAVRVAAAAQGDRARLSPGLPDHPAGPRARPHPARARRRALPRHPDGDARAPGSGSSGRPSSSAGSPSSGSRWTCWRCSASAGRRAIWSGSLCGVVLVGLSLYVVWRHPDRESGERTSRGHRLGAWLLSLYLVVVWLLLFTGSPTPFYVGVILLLLPIAIRCADLAVKHVLRPAGQRSCRRRRPLAGGGHGRAGPARRAADRRRLPDRLAPRPRSRRHDHARHHGDAPPARRDQCRGDPAPGRLRLAPRARLDRLPAGRGQRRRRGRRPTRSRRRARLRTLLPILRNRAARGARRRWPC